MLYGIKYQVMKNRKRTETDSLGEIKIDYNKLWGAQTQRSLENFRIGDQKMSKELVVALGYQKKAAAQANMKLGVLDRNRGNKIVNAANNIINLKLYNEFPLSIWQTGSGTHTNMNANEVISNFVIKKLKKKLGSKDPIHPNDHANLSQSSNDTFPTIMHVAINELTHIKFIPEVKNLIKAFKVKGLEFRKVIKIGRTHLQDATPIALGNEFMNYSEQIEDCLNRILLSSKELLYIAQGGTAVGSGINCPKKFDKYFCYYLNKLTKNKYKPAKNKYNLISSHDSLVNFSNTINLLANTLVKITNDIRFYASGPRAGINELILPENEPGSSIMPGKINPTQIEALSMVCFQVIGNNLTVNLSGSQGHFQLNAYKPVIAHNIIESINLLADSIQSFNKNCLKNIKANIAKIDSNLNNSLMLVTALNKTIGYDKAAKIAKKAYSENITLKEAALKLKFISAKEFDTIVDPKKMI